MESKKWSTGYTLMTSNTKRWSKDEINRNDEVENKIIFEGFTPEDNGKSRKRIAICNNKEDAAHIVKCVNAHDELVQIAKKAAFLFSNEANYPKGTFGHLLCQDAKQALMNAGEETI